MKNFDRIKASIQAVDMHSDDKITITDIFAQISDENLEGIADLFEKKPEWVTIFNDTRKKKLEAYEAGNENVWEEILEQEKKYLADLTYGLD